MSHLGQAQFHPIVISIIRLVIFASIIFVPLFDGGSSGRLDYRKFGGQRQSKFDFGFVVFEEKELFDCHHIPSMLTYMGNNIVVS